MASAPSPGWSTARARWASPSLAPMVAMASVSGSSSTPKRVAYQVVMALRSRVMPLDAE